MQFYICKEQVSSGRVKVASGGESAFFIRFQYLTDSGIEGRLLEASKESPAEFDEAESDDIIGAGLCLAAESDAQSLLLRAEQSRMNLERKLCARGHSKNSVRRALDFLEDSGLLDDGRFASAWLRSHGISKSQGRRRLAAELSARGIAKGAAEAALDEYFAANDEEALCRKACESYLRLHKSDFRGDKLAAHLARAGFPFKLIKKVADL